MRIFKPMQSYLLVTLIAALIWLYAEGQNVRTDTRTVTVALPARIGQDLVADFVAGSDQLTVAVTFKGATSALDQLKVHLGATGAVELPVQSSMIAATGKQTLNLSMLFPQVRVEPEKPGSLSVSEQGISVVGVEPGEVAIIVDKLVTKDVRVVFDPRGVQLGPSVKINPATIPVTLPQSFLDRLAGSDDALFVAATIPAGRLSDMPEGVEQTLPLTLELSKPLGADKRVERHIKLGVTTADVTFTIARQQDSLAVQLVPVWVSTPPSELRRYDVTLADESRVLREVTITGPRDLIERLRSKPNEMRVIAQFQLTGDMLDKGVTSAPISSVEIQQVSATGQGRVLHVVPVNPAALAAGGEELPTTVAATKAATVPTFLSQNISIFAPTAMVRFTVVKREQPATTGG
ncbi:MAG: hypothetical protein WC058_08220 [Phycisphaeraceae bacterium]